MSKRKKIVESKPVIREGGAIPHGALANNQVHVFVDDQNLFWGIVNDKYGPGFRIDFGRLLSAAAKDKNGATRFVKSAFIAGVIPDQDSFWQAVKNQGFTVRRGYLSNTSRRRSKQDDAYLISDLVATVYEEQGPSTIVLVAGDADYAPPLIKALAKGWRTEVLFIDRGLSRALESHVHLFRTVNVPQIQFIRPDEPGNR
jgi:uncharacterized LabA/DUF88 family protein